MAAMAMVRWMVVDFMDGFPVSGEGWEWIIRICGGANGVVGEILRGRGGCWLQEGAIHSKPWT